MKVISGGQTGVDRAALDAAMALGIMVGGWCPAGRRAEDGPIQSLYPLTETPSEEYEQRTEWNVRDSSGTLILSGDIKPAGGTRYTFECAQRIGRPVMIADPSDDSAIERVLAWLRKSEISVLNVAGPRDSRDQRVYESARAFLDQLLRARLAEGQTPKRKP